MSGDEVLLMCWLVWALALIGGLMIGWAYGFWRGWSAMARRHRRAVDAVIRDRIDREERRCRTNP